MNASTILMIVACSAGAEHPREGATRPTTAAIAPGRRIELLRAMKEEGAAAGRALIELCGAARNDAATARLVADYAVGPEGLNAPALWMVLLLRAGGNVGLEVIKRYPARAATGPDRLEDLLVIAARIGPAAGDVIPYLVRERVSRQADPRMQGMLDVALACLGHESRKTTEVLEDHLPKVDDRAKGAVAVLSVAPGGAWMSPKVISELIQWLHRDEADEPCEAALALGLLGTRARSAVPVLRDLAKKEGAVGQVSELALAMLEPEQREAAMTRFLRGVAANMHMRFVFWVGRAIPAELVAPTVRLLKHEDRQVVEGAVAVLSIAGLWDPAAAEGLLRIVTERGGKDNRDLREAAAEALETIGDPGQIPALEKAFATEDSEFVRKKIRETVRILKLQAADDH